MSLPLSQESVNLLGLLLTIVNHQFFPPTKILQNVLVFCNSGAVQIGHLEYAVCKAVQIK